MSDNIKTLVCKECNCEKDINDFPIDKRAKTGHRNICNSCYNTVLKDKRKKISYDPEKIIKEYIEDKDMTVYKALLIQAIAEERDFMDVLMDSIHVKDEYTMIVNQFKNKIN